MFDLQGLLKKANMKQTELSELMGVTDSAISKVKLGKMPLPDDWKPLIKQYTGIDPDEFIHQVSEANQSFHKITAISSGEFMEVLYLGIEAQAGYLDGPKVQ